MSSRELLKIRESNLTMTGVTPVTERGSGSTTEATEINFLEAVPAIDRYLSSEYFVQC